MSELKLAQVAPKSPATLLQAVLAYKDIKAQITFLEEQLKGHKETIEAAASNTPDGKIVTEHFKVTLSICERENFKLKDAKIVLGDALAPFISTSAYTMLKVS